LSPKTRATRGVCELYAVGASLIAFSTSSRIAASEIGEDALRA
jgi:hypothetical protein